MFRTDVRKNVLEDAWMELSFIKNRLFHEEVARGISWLEVEAQLQRLERAIQEVNEHAIKDATFILSRHLSNRGVVVRQIIGSEVRDKMQPLPPPIWEHLNQIVIRLRSELTPGVPGAEKAPDVVRVDPPPLSENKTC